MDSSETSPEEPFATEERSRFSILLERLREGDNVAAEALLSEFGPGLLRAVRRRMNPRLRERYDSQDFTQAVWASFFGNIGQVSRFERMTDLVRYLAAMARNKVVDAGRHAQSRQEIHSQTAATYEVNRDLRLGISEPTPSQHAVAHEQMHRLAESENPQARHVISMRTRGMTQQEIATSLRISERHVRRILNRLQRKTEL